MTEPQDWPQPATTPSGTVATRLVCRHCGFQSDQGFFMTEGVEVQSFWFDCPECGRRSEMVDEGGALRVERVDGHLQMVLRQLSAKELKGLRDTVREIAKTKDATAEDVVTAV